MVYKTKSGSRVILFDFDAGGEKPLVGVYEAALNEWVAAQWSTQGHFNVQGTKYIASSLDLANPPKFEKLTFDDAA